MLIFRIEMTTSIAFVRFTSRVIKIQGLSKGGSEDFREVVEHVTANIFCIRSRRPQLIESVENAGCQIRISVHKFNINEVVLMKFSTDLP